MHRRFVPNLDAHLYLETFFVSAVCGLLGVRFYLYVTGFPQVGGKGLHIAHMLWGGLLMMVGLVLLLAYAGRFAQRLSAILGGAGFGIFVDELGKFLTSNNDYFFKPAAALIYVTFLLLYVGIYYALRWHGHARGSQLVLALQALVEAVAQDFDRLSLRRVRDHLDHCDADDRVSETLRDLVAELRGRPEPRRGLIRSLRIRLDKLYDDWADAPNFLRAVVVGFTVWAIAHTITDAVTVFGLVHVRKVHGEITAGTSGFLVAVFTLISAALVIAGDLVMLRSRMTAYQLYKYAMLVTIFLTTEFQFYRVQFYALVGLAQAITGLVIANDLIRRERRYLRHVRKPMSDDKPTGSPG